MTILQNDSPAGVNHLAQSQESGATSNSAPRQVNPGPPHVSFFVHQDQYFRLEVWTTAEHRAMTVEEDQKLELRAISGLGVCQVIPINDPLEIAQASLDSIRGVIPEPPAQAPPATEPDEEDLDEEPSTQAEDHQAPEKQMATPTAPFRRFILDSQASDDVGHTSGYGMTLDDVIKELQERFDEAEENDRRHFSDTAVWGTDNKLLAVVRYPAAGGPLEVIRMERPGRKGQPATVDGPLLGRDMLDDPSEYGCRELQFDVIRTLGALRRDAQQRVKEAEQLWEGSKFADEDKDHWQARFDLLCDIEFSTRQLLVEAIFLDHGVAFEKTDNVPRPTGDDWPACAFEADGSIWVVAKNQDDEPILNEVKSGHFDSTNFDMR